MLIIELNLKSTTIIYWQDIFTQDNEATIISKKLNNRIRKVNRSFNILHLLVFLGFIYLNEFT